MLFFICNVIGTGQVRIKDAEIICTRSPGKYYLSIVDLVSYCLALGWIQISEDVLSVSPDLVLLLNDKEKLNDALIASTVDQLFKETLMDASMFYYDSVQCCYAFKNELFPLSLSSLRNVLISQGFLIPSRDTEMTRFYISPTYEILIAKHCKARRKLLSLKQLKRQLEENELAGEKAEEFVFEYERKRLGQPLSEKVRRISEIDVTAGYDIVSFDSNQSAGPERFIVVKAVSNIGFYWSRNEYEIAKLKGDTYYLYLVNLNRINEQNYSPKMIQNPAINIMDTDEWFVEPQSYYVKHI